MIGSHNRSALRSVVFLVQVVLMNLWVYPALLLWTLFGILVFPLLFALGLLCLRQPADRLARWFIWVYGRGWLLLMSPFVSFRREEIERIPRDRPCVFVVNHFSFFDTYCMALLPQYDIVFAVRSWPFRLFWYSAFMRLARYLDVEGSSWQETLSNSQSVFAGGGTVLFFPEGHRSRNSEIQRFYSGGFKVAIHSGVDVVPLCIDGTDKLLPPGRRLFHPCRVTLRVLDPVSTTKYQQENGHIRLRKRVKEQMTRELAIMRKGQK